MRNPLVSGLGNITCIPWWQVPAEWLSSCVLPILYSTNYQENSRIGRKGGREGGRKGGRKGRGREKGNTTQLSQPIVMILQVESSDFPTHMVGSYLSNSCLLPLTERTTCHVPHDCKPFPTEQSFMSTESILFFLEPAPGNSQSKEVVGAGS